MDLHPGEETVFEGHPSWRAVLRFYVIGVILVGVAAAVGALVSGTGVAILGGGVVLALVVLGEQILKREQSELEVGRGTRADVAEAQQRLEQFRLDFVTRTSDVITTERLHIRRGLLSKKTQETRIERVQNVNTQQSLFERLLQVGTVDFETAGTDDSEFRFVGVANPAEVVRAVDRAQRSISAAGG